MCQGTRRLFPRSVEGRALGDRPLTLVPLERGGSYSPSIQHESSVFWQQGAAISAAIGMGPDFFSLVTKKLVATVISVGSMFYSTISGVNAQLEDIALRSRGNYLVMSVRLTRCFSEELDQIFGSGKEIKFFFLVEVLEEANGETVKERIFYHSVTYSLIDHTYRVYQSENETNIDGLSVEEAKSILARVTEARVVSADELIPGKEFLVKVKAFMTKLQLPGVEGETKLMFYWNSIKPSVTAPPFTRNIFEQ